MSKTANSLPDWAKKTPTVEKKSEPKISASVARAKNSDAAAPCWNCSGLVFWFDPYRRPRCTFCEPPQHLSQIKSVAVAAGTQAVDELWGDLIRAWKKISVCVDLVAGLTFDEPKATDDSLSLRWRGLWVKSVVPFVQPFCARVSSAGSVIRDSENLPKVTIVWYRLGPLEDFLSE